MRALLGTAPHICQVVVLELRTVPPGNITLAFFARKGGLISQNALIEWFQKVNSPQNRQLTVSISDSTQEVNDFWGELTL